MTTNLRKQLIRLAYSKPELRYKLLPLLGKTSSYGGDLSYWKSSKRIPHDYEEDFEYERDDVKEEVEGMVLELSKIIKGFRPSSYDEYTDVEERSITIATDYEQEIQGGLEAADSEIQDILRKLNPFLQGWKLFHKDKDSVSWQKKEKDHHGETSHALQLNWDKDSIIWGLSTTLIVPEQ